MGPLSDVYTQNICGRNWYICIIRGLHPLFDITYRNMIQSGPADLLFVWLVTIATNCVFVSAIPSVFRFTISL
jgi:hypothetical protein